MPAPRATSSRGSARSSSVATRATVVGVSAAHATDVAAEFLDALALRDFDGLAGTFAEDGKLRGLVPSALREAEGREAIAERFRIWNGELADFEVLDSEIAEVEDVLRLRWRVRGVDADDGLSAYEQTAYASVGPDGIAWMNLVCSGSRPLEA